MNQPITYKDHTFTLYASQKGKLHIAMIQSINAPTVGLWGEGLTRDQAIESAKKAVDDPFNYRPTQERLPI
jgi:hypothetical protein